MPPPPQEQQQQPRRPQGGRRPRPPPAPPPMAMSYSDDMASFYDAWVVREEQLAADLAAALALPAARQRRDAAAPLVDAAVGHVAAYYEHKARLADLDVVAALDPRWLNPLERTFLWTWGWKPALVFRFVDSAAAGAGAGTALEEIRAATAAAEREVDREVAAVQESLAGPRVLAALRWQQAPPRNGEAAAAADDAVAAVGRALRVLLGAADALRERTLRAAVALLAPEQAAAAVGAMLRFHLGVRRAGRDWGSGQRGV
ncbi:unnamed protein product [Urochloa humidicola]